MLKNECAEPITVEIGGQDSEREFVTRTFYLPLLERVKLPAKFFSLAYIHVDRPVDARIGIHSTAHDETYLMDPHEWGNI